MYQFDDTHARTSTRTRDGQVIERHTREPWVHAAALSPPQQRVTGPLRGCAEIARNLVVCIVIHHPRKGREMIEDVRALQKCQWMRQGIWDRGAYLRDIASHRGGDIRRAASADIRVGVVFFPGEDELGVVVVLLLLWHQVAVVLLEVDVDELLGGRDPRRRPTGLLEVRELVRGVEDCPSRDEYERKDGRTNLRTHCDPVGSGHIAELVIAVECLLGEAERGRYGGLEGATCAGLAGQDVVDMIHRWDDHRKARRVAREEQCRILERLHR